eukprot:CAMPEP_0177591630 /NCGR_PEP_ID=MMETSP0419_2-20121207/8105_1 /TAXON_ID=582737 /ORGANISM="Tetraselmis sp., Strain GSL018" /LENGTH=367 /DNA_ID=CAMNT_0019082395 /DNA_START=334 /DNA_END=1438 /DNA_ORIENTATION=-
MTKLLGRGSARQGAAVMLLPEHWLEVRHPDHRSHLKPYFNYWKDSNTTQGFFYWLDKGDGKDVDLPERPRAQLEATRVRYCGPELALLEVCVEDGLLKYRIGRRLVHTPAAPEAPPSPDPARAHAGGPGGSPLAGPRPQAELEEGAKAKWIYVLDLQNRMFINRKQSGEFHHSSFTRGAPVRAAGSIVVDRGRILQITAWSGHYRPRREDFREVIHFLETAGVDMSQVEQLVSKDKGKATNNGPEWTEWEKMNDLSLRRVSAPPTSSQGDHPSGSVEIVADAVASEKSGNATEAECATPEPQPGISESGRGYLLVADFSQALLNQHKFQGLGGCGGNEQPHTQQFKAHHRVGVGGDGSRDTSAGRGA